MTGARYEDRSLMDRLAREYVLGTMPGAARRRFQNLYRASPMARQSVAAWEQRLVPLVDGVKPEQPPAGTWRAISVRLGFEQPGHTRGSGVWMGIAAALAAATVSLGLLYLAKAPEIESPTYVTIVTDEEIGPVWVVQTFVIPRELRANVVNTRMLPDESDYELWMLPDDGTTPVSLGLIPRTGQTVLPLVQAQLDVLAQTSTLAVSIEPVGGSPTGAPTGPVIYTAPLVPT